MKGKLLSLLLLVTVLLAGCTAEEQPSQATNTPSESSSAADGADGQESPGDVEPPPSGTRRSASPSRCPIRCAAMSRSPPPKTTPEPSTR